MHQYEEEEQCKQKILAQAMKLLARREHSRAGLAIKLAQRGYQKSETDAVLDECEARNWLDDQRYADAYVQQRKASLYGPLRILAELQQRGISGQPENFSAISESEWRASALNLREKKFGLTGSLEWKERGRQGRFLAQRGFTMSQIEYALERHS